MVNYEDMLNCEHQFAPDIEKMTMDGPAPVTSDDKGNYPWPEPGVKKKREY